MISRKILIIDDNDSIHLLYRDFFESRGYCAESAENGLEGVDKYRMLRPDVVLMDVQMPVMNGYESSKGIKAFDPDAKILMITGHTQDPLATQSLREGYVSHVLQKGWNLDALFKTVVQVLAA